ncbi:hypothetical protein BHAP_1309 [Bifidobacterium hapali]|uniref:Uncharacterized protein n=1 Tax=Bifidobacterium hapali TaxID=1630172 RepID=A0A261FY95_9BIFI|nr:hypothetical protein [Bifidobacterium hapali]OZG64142.1 hypothetical protein BHAP_1309 [Bifidobacterium hapali]
MSIVDVGVRLERAPHRLTAQQARAELDRLRALFPAKSAIAAMGPDDVKRELAKRD